MTLAEKIVQLRKKQGWSQEELAARLQVSRQSVSKWESMASMPDLDKVVKLSQIFSVSTDYLLNEEELPDEEPGGLPVPSASSPALLHPVSLDEANSYLSRVRKSSRRIALGVAMCILSPVPVILLGGMSEQPGSVIREEMASGLGTGALLLLIAAAVALFIAEGFHLEKYSYLEKEPIETEYGVAGIAERKMEEYAPRWRSSVILGVCLCILAVLPLLLAAGFAEENEMLLLCMTALLLILIAGGVFLLVESGMIQDSFRRLLEEGDYTREKKRRNRKNAPITAVYWCLATAVYLGWSLLTNDWGRTWILWPVAGLLFAALAALTRFIQDQKENKNS